MKHREPQKRISASLFGQLVRRKREDAKLTQMDVARIAFSNELRASEVSELETGPRQRTIQASTVAAYKAAFDLTDAEIDTCRRASGAAENPETDQLALTRNIDQTALDAIDKAVSGIKAELVATQFSQEILQGIVSQFLNSVGRSNTPFYLWPAALHSLASEFIALKDSLSRAQNLPHHILKARGAISVALAAGDFETARNEAETINRWTEAEYLSQVNSLEQRADVFASSLAASAYIMMLDRQFAAAKLIYLRILALMGLTSERRALARKSATVSFNAMISLAKDLASGRELLKEMQDKDIPADPWTYSTLISLAKDLASGRELLKEMQDKDIPADTVTYNTLISLAKDLASGRELLKEMQDKDIPANTVTYSTLISLAKDLASGRELLKEMQDKDIPANTVTYSTLISLAKDLASGRELLKEMQDKDIPADPWTYSTLISLAKDLASGRELLKEMQDKDIPANTVTYSTLISLAKDLASGRELLKEMQDKDIPADPWTYSTLISLAKDLASGRELLKEMQDKDIPANTVTYSTLISLAKDLASGRELLKEMQDKDIPANTVTYSTLISLAKDLASGRELLKEMQDKDIPANTVTYNTLISLAKDLASGRELLKEMQDKDIPADPWTYSTLISLAKDLASGRELLKEMQDKDIPANTVTYSTLISLAKDLASGRELLKEMQDKDIPANTVTYNTLISLAKDLASGRELLKEMQDKDIPADPWTYSTLISLATDFFDALNLVAEIDHSQPVFSRGLYCALFSKPLGHLTAEEVLAAYFAGFRQFPEALEGPINQFRAARKPEEAFKIALVAPHTAGAQRFFRERYAVCRPLFHAALDSGVDDDNMHYAFGIAACLNGEWEPAQTHLAIARARATHAKRIEHVDRLLAGIPGKSG